jgi:hypothetical protein
MGRHYFNGLFCLSCTAPDPSGPGLLKAAPVEKEKGKKRGKKL